MYNPNKPAPKNVSSSIPGKENREQAEKDKRQATEKREGKKDASGKPFDKSDDCC